MNWGTGPLNVWNLLLAVLLVGAALGGLVWKIWNWRREAQRAFEEHEALERGDPVAVERMVVGGVLSLLMATAGVVVFAVAPEGERWKGVLGVLFFGLCAVVLLRKGLQARARGKREGRA